MHCIMICSNLKLFLLLFWKESWPKRTVFSRIHRHTLYTKPPIFKNGQVVSDISACRTLFGDYGTSYYLKLWHQSVSKKFGHQVLQFTWNLVSALPELKSSNVCKGFFLFFRLFMAFFGKNFTKIARGPSLKIFEFGVSVLRHAVIYETTYFLWSLFFENLDSL